MLVPPIGDVGGALSPGFRGVLASGSRGGLSVARSCRACAVDLVTDGDHEAAPCGVIATDARGVEVAELVVRGVEEPLEHHWVWYAGEVPLCVPMRGGGWQLASGAMVGLVVGGSDEVPDRQEVVPGRSSYVAMPVLADEAYVVATLCIPWGNRGFGITRSPVGAIAVSLAGASRCEATRAARCHSIRAWREHWPERRRRRGAEGLSHPEISNFRM
jgi:hypothetical protein